MKRAIAVILVMLVACTGIGYADADIDLSAYTYEELLELGHLLIDEMTSRPEWSGDVASVSENSGDTAEEDNITPNEQVEDTQNGNRQAAFVKNYVGLNLSSCGYTSMGGERRDYYADTNLLLVLVSVDGTYVDPQDKDQLLNYTVVGQYPSPETEFYVQTDADGDTENKGYEEIILIVSNGEESVQDIPLFAEVRPSPDKSTQYVRNYTGRLLETIGYTAMNGNHYDKYGPDGLIQIIIVDENGETIDKDDKDYYKYYIVTDQSVAPDTEMTFTYTKNSSGDEEATAQTVDIIKLTVRMTEVGQAEINETEAEEAALREAGLLTDMYEGVYEVGVDIPAGNYRLTQISNSCDVYVYQDKAAYDSSEGEWSYLYGTGDMEYFALKDGMYIKIASGAAKAIRSDFNMEGSTFELYSGIFRVGTDIPAGNYEISQISDSSDVYVYQDEDALKNEEGDWSYLYGDGDKEYFSLREGMILEIATGAVTVIVK